jgi:4-amino-4-deoxy-L-arabinose transferase-like glycosyltransferase
MREPMPNIWPESSSCRLQVQAARAANLFLAMLIGLMVAALAQRVTDDRSVGIPAALIFWFHPGTLIAEARGGVEIFFIFFLMLFMFSLYRALDRATTLDYFIAGLTLGCVVLVKYTAAISGAVRHFLG